jgi:ABC-2 type transport system permease protein
MVSLIRFLHKPAAFIKKDFRVATSYRLNFFMQFFGVLFSSTLFFMVSQMIGTEKLPSLAQYGSDYFTFLLVGVALTDYFTVATSAFASEIRGAQVVGTLESLLVTPTSIATILLSSFLYRLLITSVRIFLYFLVGITLFDANLNLNNLPAIATTFFLILLPFVGIGLISASFIIVLKQGSPISSIVSISSGLLGGVLYPVQVLPDWIQPVSQFLPITHGLEAMRQILINDGGFVEIGHQLLVLSCFALLFMGSGIFSIIVAVRIARKEGSLLHY